MLIFTLNEEPVLSLALATHAHQGEREAGQSSIAGTPLRAGNAQSSGWPCRGLTNRRLAAVVLGFLGRELAATVPPLVNALQDEDDTVRRFAAESLEKIAPARGQRNAA